MVEKRKFPSWLSGEEEPSKEEGIPDSDGEEDSDEVEVFVGLLKELHVKLDESLKLLKSNASTIALLVSQPKSMEVEPSHSLPKPLIKAPAFPIVLGTVSSSNGLTSTSQSGQALDPQLNKNNFSSG